VITIRNCNTGPENDHSKTGRSGFRIITVFVYMLHEYKTSLKSLKFCNQLFKLWNYNIKKLKLFCFISILAAWVRILLFVESIWQDRFSTTSKNWNMGWVRIQFFWSLFDQTSMCETGNLKYKAEFDKCWHFHNSDKDFFKFSQIRQNLWLQNSHHKFLWNNTQLLMYSYLTFCIQICIIFCYLQKTSVIFQKMK
jgi:hypothetical protein